jgi:hypothetical protein
MIITKLHIIDWYDDIVTSLTSFGNEVYIFNCIQKNFVSGEKVYYCVKIGEGSFKQIESILEKKNLTGGDWNILNLIFKKNNTDENIFLLKTELRLVGSDITFNKVNYSEIININFPFDISTLYTKPL